MGRQKDNNHLAWSRPKPLGVRLSERLARTCCQSAPGVDALPTNGCLVNTFDLIRNFLGPERKAAEDTWLANHKGAEASRKTAISRPELRCQSGAPPANGRVAQDGTAFWVVGSEHSYFLVLVLDLVFAGLDRSAPWSRMPKRSGVRGASSVRA